jgi:DNA-binding MarR family transcriptional regulator
MVKLSENAKVVMRRLQELEGADVTVHDLSEDIGLPVNSITGIFNSFVKKGLGERVIAEVELEDGSHKKVKFLKLTDAGLALDVDAVEED